MSRRGNFTFRISDQLKASIQEAATENQRSLSEEVEARLLASFDEGRIGALIDKRIAQAAVGASRREALNA